VDADETPGASDEDEDLSPPSTSSSFFGSAPPNLGVATSPVGVSGAGGHGRGSRKGQQVGDEVPHYGDALGGEEGQEDHSPTPNKSQCCTVALMDVNYLTDVMQQDGKVAWSKISQWRFLGYLSAGEEMEWKISSVTPIWPPF
jgi:hypothetical protein